MHKNTLLAGVAAAALANTEGVRYANVRREREDSPMIDLGPSELDKKRIAKAQAKRERIANRNAEICARNLKK
jgi:hypothetical protein